MAAEDRDLNRDPLTDEPGSHPVGTGVGATGGALAGVAAGMVGGPVGMAVGGVIGAVVGGLAGHAAAEAINPTAEEAHWRDNYTNEPYYEAGRSFDDYGPAYRHGLESRTRYEEDWQAAEPKLESDWERSRGGSSLNWQQARPATRAAWDRVDALRSGQGGATVSGSARDDLAHYGTGLSSTDSTLHTDQGHPDSERDLSGRGVSSTSMGASSDKNWDPSDTGRAGSTAGYSTGDTSGSGPGSTSGTSIGSGLGSTSGVGMGSTRAAGMGSNSGLGMASDLGTSSVGSGTGSSDYADSSNTRTNQGVGTGGGAAAAVGSAQQAGDNSGDTADVVDTLNNLIECCKDGEYGFRECAEQADRQDLKTVFNQCAEDCARGAQELQQLVRSKGGNPDDGGSAMGAMHRGWVSVKAALSTYDDKAVLEEAERGEDNAKARYRKALEKNLPQQVRDVVQRQFEGVQRNHDQIKMLRNQARGNA